MPRTPDKIDPTMTAIGDTLRAAREAAKISQAELADRIGRRQGAIGQWESGRRCPALRDLPAIAAAVGVRPWILARKIFEKIREST